MRTTTLRALAESSAALIEEYQHSSGAYPACPGYPVYRFSWLRDGSFIADAMSRAGRTNSADAFFGWCTRVIMARSAQIEQAVCRARRGETVDNEDLMAARYTLDGDDDPSPWWNFQLDGYGTWLWALAAHLDRHPQPADDYRSAVSSTVDYLVAFGLRPCYDWWEEHIEHRHTSTLGAIAAGLSAATALTDGQGRPLLEPGQLHQAAATHKQIIDLIGADGTRDGHLTKWLGSAAVDGSVLACVVPFLTTPPATAVAEQTYHEVLRQLAPGGVYRYLGDTFYGGGEWLILTCWLGWYEAKTGRMAEALTRLQWVADQATSDGWLPEQVSSAAQRPECIAEWTNRWGPVATPLLWSHAMYLTLATECGIWPPATAPTRDESSC